MSSPHASCRSLAMSRAFVSCLQTLRTDSILKKGSRSALINQLVLGGFCAGVVTLITSTAWTKAQPWTYQLHFAAFGSTRYGGA